MLRGKGRYEEARAACSHCGSLKTDLMKVGRILNTGYHRLARVDGRSGGRLADGDGNVIGWEEQF